jgi:DNA-binding CsgD family transcriptional regulator
MDINEAFDEPAHRRWVLLSKALESMPLNEALRLAQSAEDFLRGGSDFEATDRRDDLHQTVATKPLQAPATMSVIPLLVSTNELPGGAAIQEDNGLLFDVSANLAEPRNSVAPTGPLRLPNNGVLRKEGRRALTPRENDILMHIVRGDTNKAIARHLEITDATVKVHIRSIMRKIPAANRTQAAIWAMNNVEASDQPSQ